MAHNAKHQVRHTRLTDEFTTLLQELGVMERITKSAPLTAKFDRVYSALSREDQDRDLGNG